MNKVWIVGGKRSFIGVEGGMYRNISAEKLGAAVLRQVLDTCNMPERDVDLIVAGNGVGAGGNLARLMLLEAGLDETIPAMTVDVQCGSGLEAIAVAAAKIRSGFIDVAIAGGVESCSTKPIRIRNPHHPDYKRDTGDGEDAFSVKDDKALKQRLAEQNIYQTAKFAPGKPDEMAMIRGAENTAAAWNMDRERLDQYVVTSHRRAAKAAEEGELLDILAAPCSSWKPDGVHGMREENAREDEGIRRRMSAKLLKRLPALLPDGTYITAGNACLTHDGAAFVVLCSDRYIHAHGMDKIAEIVDVVSAGSPPERSPESILPAIDKLLLRNHLLPEQITAWEYNEAFAVLDCLMEEYFGRDTGRYNIFGGALAYGHPYGASGGILILHLLQALNKLGEPLCMQEYNRGKYGIAAIAAAGGIGTAMLLKRV